MSTLSRFLKYIQIDSEQDVEFNIANKDNTSIMEMSVSLEKKDETEDNKSWDLNPKFYRS